MRLWHIDLINVLPRQQILEQWRELNSIFKLRSKHVLINFVYEEPLWNLYAYSLRVIGEMGRRGYSVNLNNFDNFFQKHGLPDLPLENPYSKKMNKRYLLQCYYNLQEKYDCGSISDKEWFLIEKRINDVF